jgi:hypothetical protein
LVEQLETRQVLSAVSWTGNGDGTSWFDPQNWSTQSVPGSADDVAISVAGNPMITLDTTGQSSSAVTVHSLVVSDTLDLVNAALTPTSSMTVNGGTLDFNGGSIAGNVAIVDSALNIGQNSTGAALFVMYGNDTLSGNVAASQEIDVQSDFNTGNSNGDNATLTTTGNVANAGLIVLSSQRGDRTTTLIDGGTSLTNLPTGTLLVDSANGGGRQFTGSLTNEGMIGVEGGTGLTWNNANATFLQTSGLLHVVGSLGISGGDITLDGGAMAIDGSMSASDDNFAFNGGTVPAGALNLIDDNLAIGAGSTGTAALVMYGNNTLTGTVAVNQAITVMSDFNTGNSSGNNAALTLAAGSANAGRITLASQRGDRTTTLTVNEADFINTGVIDISATNGGGRTLTLTTGDAFTNDNTLHVESGTGLGVNNVTFDQESGTIQVDANASLAINGGAFALDGGTIANNQSFTVAGPTFAFNGGSITGNPASLIDESLAIGSNSTGAAAFTMYGLSQLSGTVADSQSITVMSDFNTGNISGNNATLTTAGDVTNAGSITLASQRGDRTTTLIDGGTSFTNLASGNLVIDATNGGGRQFTGNLTNQGTVEVQAGIGLTLANAGATYLQTGGTLSVGGGLNVNGGTIALDAGTIATGGTLTASGNDVLFNGGSFSGSAVSLIDDNLTIAAGSTGAAQFVMYGKSVLSGTLASSQSITVMSDFNTGNSSGNNATLTLTDGTANAGTITLASQRGDRTTTLIVAEADFVNSAVLDISATNGGGRTITLGSGDMLANEGTLHVESGIGLSVNNATFDQESGAIQVDVSGSLGISGGAVAVDGGTLTNNGAVTASGGTFAFHGGSIPGNAVNLIDEAFSIDPSSTGAAAFVMYGNDTLSGGLAAGQVITVMSDFNTGNSNGNNATLTTLGDLANAGTITLASQRGDRTTNLIDGGSSLTNDPGGAILIDATNGGGRAITGNFTNEGTVTVASGIGLTLNNAGATFLQNAGTFTVNGSLSISGGNVAIGGGTLANNGAIVDSGNALSFDGGAIPGSAVTMIDDSLVIDPTATGTAAFVMYGNDTLSGGLAAGQAITVVSDFNTGNSSGNNATLTTLGAVSSAGTITLASQRGDRTTTLVLGANFTNAATGLIEDDSANGGGRSISIPSGDTLTNYGTLRAEAGITLGIGNPAIDGSGTLDVQGTLSLGGNLANSGRLDVESSGVVTVGSMNELTNQPGATITGTGTIDVSSPLINDGTVAPGSPLGMLTISGTYQQNADGTLALTVAGTGSGQASFLYVTGGAVLGGMLAISEVPSYQPSFGDVVQVVRAGVLTGTFAAIQGSSAGANLFFELIYNSTTVTLVADAVPTVTQVMVTTDSIQIDFFDYAGMNAASVTNPAAYALIGSGGDGTFGDGNDVNEDANIASITYDPGTQVATINLATPLPVDLYQITIQGTGPDAVTDLGGTPLFGGANDVTTFLVPSIALASSPTSAVWGQSVTVTATLAPVATGLPTPSGTLLLYDGTTELGSALLNGTGSASFTIATLAVGTHALAVEYLGDASFTPVASPALTESIGQASSAVALASSADPSLTGQSLTFTATVTAVEPGTGVPTGSVTFYADGTALGAPVALDATGKATTTTSSLATGIRAITAAYAGDTNFIGAGSQSLTQDVRYASASTLSGPARGPVYGQSVTFTATVKAVAPGTGTPTGTVTFYDNGSALGGPVTLVSGVAQLAIKTLSVGTHSITESYCGDGAFRPSGSTAVAMTVSQASTTTTLTASADPSVFGQAVTFAAVVKALVPGSGTPTGTVTFYDNGVSLPGGPIALISGKAAFKYSGLRTGTHGITASYSGDANFLPSAVASALTQTVNLASTTATLSTSLASSVFGQTVTFKAAIKAVAPGSGTLTGTVTFVDTLTSTTLGTGTLVNGVASLTTRGLAVGSHSVVGTYSGDTNFLASTSAAVAETVNQSATKTTLTGSKSWVTYGTPITFNARVSAVSPGSGIPTGAVTFFIDGVAIAPTVTIDATGRATYTIANLSKGSHTITASYGGDPNDLASSSGALTVTVS